MCGKTRVSSNNSKFELEHTSGCSILVCFIFSDRLTASEVLNQKWLAISQSPVEAEDQPITKRVRRRSRKNAEVKQVSDQSAPIELSCDFGPIGVHMNFLA